MEIFKLFKNNNLLILFQSDAKAESFKFLLLKGKFTLPRL